MLRKLQAIFLLLLALPSFGEENKACTVIQNEVETTLIKKLYEQGPEKVIGSICGYPEKSCEYQNKPIPFDTLEKSGIKLKEYGLQHIIEGNELNASTIEMREVDINNDGLTDIRLIQFAGTADCQRNYFLLRKSDGTYSYKEFYKLTSDETGGFCFGDTLITRQVGSFNYLVAYSRSTTLVYQLLPFSQLIEVCKFLPKTNKNR